MNAKAALALLLIAGTARADVLSALDNHKPAVVMNPRQDSLWLSDGSFLRGQWIGGAGTSIQWSHGETGADLSLDWKLLQRFENSSPNPPEEARDCLRLLDGSTLTGQLKKIDADNVNFLVAGTRQNVSFPKAQVVWVSLDQTGDLGMYDLKFFGAGTSLVRQRLPFAQITHEVGGMRHDANLRSFPNASIIDLEYSGTTTGLTLHLFRNETASRPLGQMYFRILNNSFYGRIYFKAGATQSLSLSKEGLDKFTAAGKKDGAVSRFRLLLLRKEKKASLYRNGDRIQDWNLNEEPGADGGSGLMLQSTYILNQENPFELRSLVVRPWDGVEPGEESRPSWLNKKNELTLASDIVFDGKTVSGVDARKKDVSLPRGEVSFLRLLPEPPPAPPPPGTTGFLLPTRGGMLAARDFQFTKDSFETVLNCGVSLNFRLKDIQRMDRQPHKSLVPPPAYLRFRNGDALSGRPVSLTSGGDIVWSFAGQPALSFRQKHVIGTLSVPPVSAEEKPPSNSMTVLLKNSDWFNASVESWAGGKFIVKTDFGTLTLDQTRARALAHQRLDESSVISVGYQPFLWTSVLSDSSAYFDRNPVAGLLRSPGFLYTDGSWHFEIQGDGQRPLARSVSHLPDRFTVSFSFESKGEDGSCNMYSNANVNLIGEKSDAGVFSSWSANRITLNVQQPGERGQRITNQQFSPLAKPTAGPVRCAMAFDLTSNTITCFLNGESVGKIVQKGLANTLRQNLRMIVIPGTVPGSRELIMKDLTITPGSPLTPQMDDRVFLANGDHLDFQAQTMKNGSILFDTSFGPIDVPLNRISLMEFGPEDAAETPGVNVRLARGGKLRLNDVALKDGVVTGVHADLGKVGIPWDQVSEISLNPPKAP